MVKNRAFSLIEIIIAVAIIALISAAAIIGLGQQRAQSRDARRISDGGSVGAATENYLSVKGTWNVPGYAFVSNAALDPLISGGFLSVAPIDPKPGGAGGNNIDICNGYYFAVPAVNAGAGPGAWAFIFGTEMAPINAVSNNTILPGRPGNWGKHPLNNSVNEFADTIYCGIARYDTVMSGHVLINGE